mgnify:CR=1 FL=1
MTKRIVIGACLMAMAASMFAAPKKAEGKVLNIYVWNDEFPSRFNDFYASKLPADVKVNFVQTPNADNAYQNKLDEVLLAQEKAKGDDLVDMFLVEADYALKYVDTPYTLDVKKDIGLTDEDLKKELEEHGYSSDDIEANTDAKNAKTPIPTEKEEEIRKKAMEGFEKRSKGASRISKSILYKALKNREFTEGVWDELIEKIIKDKSKRSGKEDNRHKEIRLGSKNHLWRGAVLPTYKVEKGLDKKKIYCFVDWSGSVTDVEGLIESFLGKVIHVSEKLDYEDMDVYGFAEKLSLPRTITKEMRDKDGLAGVLTDTRSYMDSQHLGTLIENFNAVAHEINIIKSKDEEIGSEPYLKIKEDISK